LLLNFEDRLHPNQIIVPSEVFISPLNRVLILNEVLVSYDVSNDPVLNYAIWHEVGDSLPHHAFVLGEILIS
jgi:hypothetical protein